MAELITLARPYAKAAFDYAKGEGLVESWLKQLSVSAGLASVDEVVDAFSSPNKDLAGLVDMLSGSGADEGYKNFIQLLADNNRLVLLPDVVSVFKTISENDAKTLSADVYTAEEISKEQVEAITASLSKRTGKTVKVTQHIDASLLSGARVVAGDLVIDGSLKAKLEKLKTELLN
ncbi:MAG TPA: F0F1 ATP synthase subunit delta [Gammaproteobacteria bacterium]|nr:F0F1 ATP synthase subunit delta [Xanthomonadales bacterium]MCB1594747.1 F0F1 ATP synthase subunit delta [Xanthomonadales bacterium]HOP21904.1 F0F1 ATP synthase subunit delta [Gammaproteobacteria bacterium]HPI96254.1 F0F1 ATP synthase subunit delta [Gammaproteobacteria bacterium]HPQ87138.1 F0F1 ATP synthase subunit delta [Gammaproteobacteria bacterium]